MRAVRRASRRRPSPWSARCDRGRRRGRGRAGVARGVDRAVVDRIGDGGGGVGGVVAVVVVGSRGGRRGGRVSAGRRRRGPVAGGTASARRRRLAGLACRWQTRRASVGASRGALRGRWPTWSLVGGRRRVASARARRQALARPPDPTRKATRGQGGQAVPLEVGHPLQHRRVVGAGLVVGQHGRAQVTRARQVAAAAAQVVGRRERRVEDVLRVPPSVPVTVAAGPAPGARAGTAADPPPGRSRPPRRSCRRRCRGPPRTGRRRAADRRSPGSPGGPAVTDRPPIDPDSTCPIAARWATSQVTAARAPRTRPCGMPRRAPPAGVPAAGELPSAPVRGGRGGLRGPARQAGRGDGPRRGRRPRSGPGRRRSTGSGTAATVGRRGRRLALPGAGGSPARLVRSALRQHGRGRDDGPRDHPASAWPPPFRPGSSPGRVGARRRARGKCRTNGRAPTRAPVTPATALTAAGPPSLRALRTGGRPRRPVAPRGRAGTACGPARRHSRRGCRRPR